MFNNNCVLRPHTKQYRWVWIVIDCVVKIQFTPINAVGLESRINKLMVS